MWRALLFLALLALAAYGAVWLANHPETISVTWAGREYTVSLAVGVTVLIAAAILVAMLLGLIRFLVTLPSALARGTRRRRISRGNQAVSRGIVAIGSGDLAGARRHARDAERLVGKEPLALLLRAQAAQAAGDRPAAEAAFRDMMQVDETRVLGLRGLYLEARRREDGDSARLFAEEAHRLAPAIGWSSDAVIDGLSQDGDWRGAIRLVERRTSLGLVDRKASRRQRAILLTADALSRESADPEGALAAAQDAVKLAPDLVPAAAFAGRMLSRRGDTKRAAKIVETAWTAAPHPELAAAYLNLRPGDSAIDRMRRAETLARLSSWSFEARLAIARAALEARELDRARDALRPLLEDRPTVRVCLAMAELEGRSGNAGGAREWLARATRAPRDKAWIADGFVADAWAPVSPVTGRLDAFRWETPPELLHGPDWHGDDIDPSVFEPMPDPVDEAGHPGAHAALDHDPAPPGTAPAPGEASPLKTSGPREPQGSRDHPLGAFRPAPPRAARTHPLGDLKDPRRDDASRLALPAPAAEAAPVASTAREPASPPAARPDAPADESPGPQAKAPAAALARSDAETARDHEEPRPGAATGGIRPHALAETMPPPEPVEPPRPHKLAALADAAEPGVAPAPTASEPTGAEPAGAEPAEPRPAGRVAAEDAPLRALPRPKPAGIRTRKLGPVEPFPEPAVPVRAHKLAGLADPDEQRAAAPSTGAMESGPAPTEPGPAADATVAGRASPAPQSSRRALPPPKVAGARAHKLGGIESPPQPAAPARPHKLAARSDAEVAQIRLPAVIATPDAATPDAATSISPDGAEGAEGAAEADAAEPALKALPRPQPAGSRPHKLAGLESLPAPEAIVEPERPSRTHKLAALDRVTDPEDTSRPELLPAPGPSRGRGADAPHPGRIPSEPEAVIFPVSHAPDDPGPDGQEDRRQRFRLRV